MKALLIAEKPSLGKNIKSVYQQIAFKDTIDFFALHGHAVRLCTPDAYTDTNWNERWGWNQLPMMPSSWKTEVIPDSKTTFNQIAQALKSNHYDYIINACDPEREGNHIFNLIYKKLGCTLPIKRFWTNSLTFESVKQALENLRQDGDGLKPDLALLTKAAWLRGNLDWLFGMNFTRASSLAMNFTAKVGRVKTAVLSMVVHREQELRNFKPVTTFELVANYQQGFSGVLLDSEGGTRRFATELEAKNYCANWKKQASVIEFKKTTEKKYAPSLYNLTGLSVAAGSAFGYSSKQVLDIAQSLYEKKITSYPRTSNKWISSSLVADFPKMLEAVAVNPQLAPYVAKLTTTDYKRVAGMKKYVDDAKMAESGHYALVPTTLKPDLSKLSKEEINVLGLIYRRFLAIFMPPMLEEKTFCLAEVEDGEQFRSSGSKCIDPGYTILSNQNLTDTTLPLLKKGDRLDITNYDCDEKVSTPPPRFSDSSLLLAMESPAKYLVDSTYKKIITSVKGIGTDATRVNIIKELVSNGYIEMKKSKKSFLIYATETGERIINNLDGLDLASVDLTAKWEERLGQVECGVLSMEEFKESMEEYIQRMLDELKNRKMETAISTHGTTKDSIGICPLCGNPIIENSKAYGCSNYRNGCSFTLWKNDKYLATMGKKMTPTLVKGILKNATKEGSQFSLKKVKDKSGKERDVTISIAWGKPYNKYTIQK